MRRFALIAFYVAWIAAFFVLLNALSLARYEAQRGIWFPGQPLPPPLAEGKTPLGTTVELTQYRTDAALDEALDEAEALGIGWLRQELPWDAIEPRQGRYRWAAWDRVLRRAHARGFELVLVINRTPEWARREGEAANPLAPPADWGEAARFAGAAAQRYGNIAAGWQLWDEPNLEPHWGTRLVVEPTDYARFLARVTPAIRAADPEAVVATAALAPTTEQAGYNMSEVQFLAGLYRAGAAPYFDAVALQPYGFAGGARERQFDEALLNLDRVVLARETMIWHNDPDTPIWFVQGGWATLPRGWQGPPAPWSSDRGWVQARRLHDAMRRTALEWPWVQRIAFQPLQPAAPRDDPRWGLALLDADGERTLLADATRRMGTLFLNGGGMGQAERAEWEQRSRPALQRYDWVIGGLWLLMAGLAGRLAWHVGSLPWVGWGDRFRRLPEPLQAATLALLALALFRADSWSAAILCSVLLAIPLAWRLDLGLAGVALAIPFYLQSKRIETLQFSMVELLLLLCAVIWVGREVRAAWQRPASARQRLAGLAARLLRPRDALDWALLAFVLWAALSLPLARYFGVAAREFRVVVAESVLWYWLLRRAELTEGQRRRLLDALVLSATAMALFGLWQWLFTADVIQAEGVRRVRGLYGSPNNLGLMLERLVPLVGAIVLLAPTGRRRQLYGAALLPLVAALFLTFSRGAWLLGMPSALLWLAWWGEPRARRWIGGALLLALLALIPFAATERIASTLNVEGGTWFIRIKLWEATAAMLRDNPLLGVGLDNFLYAYDQYRLPEAWREPDLSHPHQLFLHFWVALGLPGLALLLWQQGAFWRRWRAQARRMARGTLARALLVGLGGSMVAALAHGLIDNSYFLVDLAFIWMLTLALTAEMQEHDA